MSSLPATARRFVFTAQNTVALETFTLPPLAPDEVLVETRVSLLSTGTETIAFARNFAPGTHWDHWVRYPFYPGYASVGTVLTVGAGVSALKVGDQVASRSSHRSHEVLKADQCFPVPSDVQPEDAAWFPLAKIAGHGVRAAKIRLGDAVVVIGAGPIGQMALRWARVCGADKVIVIDLAESRLRQAAAAGALTVMASADAAIDAVLALLNGVRPRIVIDSTGNASVLKTALSLVAWHGTVVLLGDTGTPGGQTLTSDVLTRGITLVGVHDGHNTPEWDNPASAAHYFSFLRDGRFSTAGLITHHFKPEACHEAYTLASTDRLKTMGVVFEWNP